MKTINKEQNITYIINKSSFISFCFHVETKDEANEKIAEIRKLHKDATHVVHAYVIGRSGQGAHLDDDGEPSGTAAAPIIEILKFKDLTNVLIVVVRYFGGIKLGAGGLIRAYSEAAKQVIDASLIEEIIDYVKLELSFDYSYLKQITTILDDIEILNKTFDDKVLLIVRIDVRKVDELKNKLINLTQNKISIKEFS